MGKFTKAADLLSQARDIQPLQTLNPGGTNSVRDVQPGSWPFSVLQPVKPVAGPNFRPRREDFTPGYNIVWTPKADDKSVINDFQILRGFADSLDLMRMVIETRKDQMTRIPWSIRAKRQQGESSYKRMQREAQDPTIASLTEFFEYPDGEHNIQTFIRELMEDMLVLDAASIYMQRDLDHKVCNLIPFDGATIKVLSTDQGLTPKPPSAAFQQVIQGAAAKDLTTDDLYYAKRNSRTNHFYGYSPVEQIIMTIQIALYRQLYQLDFYKEGNMPEALCFLPAEVPLDRVKELEDWFNTKLKGNVAARTRLHFLPAMSDDGKPNFMYTKAELAMKDPIDEWLAKLICYAFSVSPQALEKMMNRASAGQAQENSEEEGLEPSIVWLEDTFNYILQRKMGFKDYEFKFGARRDVDLLKQRQADEIMVTKGGMTINQWREKEGMDPLDTTLFPGADIPMIVTSQGPVPLLQGDPNDAPHLQAQSAMQQTQMEMQQKQQQNQQEKPTGKPEQTAKVAKATHGSLQHLTKTLPGYSRRA